MSKQIINALPELIEAGLITTETAAAIEGYYEQRRDASSNKLLMVFAILGALLTGLGIILIIAHNWDNYTQTTKTFFAFLPLLVGQLASGYTILRKPDNRVWQEASAVFLTLAVGASISLVSQIYNLLGDLSSFLFWWTLLCLPLMYLLRSSMASLLFWCGATYYGCQAGYFEWNHVASPWYWLFILAALPYYYLLIKRSPAGNFTNFHNLIVPASVVTVLGVEAHHHAAILFLCYMFLFGLLHILGMWIKNWRPMSNISGYQLAGKLGPLVLLLWFSFHSSWVGLFLNYNAEPIWSWPENYWFMGLMLLSLALMYGLQLQKIKVLNPFNLLPFGFAVIFFISLYNPFISTVLVNLLLLGIGVATVVEGNRKNSIATLNIGLLTLTGLLICRFFDMKIDFVARGILFIIVGIGFFLCNYWLIKKKKA